MIERRTDEAELVARVQRLIEEHPDAKVITFDPDTLDDRPEVGRLIGVPPEQMSTGPDVLASVRPEDQPVLIGHILQVVETGEVSDIVGRADGSMLSASLFDLRQTFDALVGVSFTVSAGVAAEHGPSQPLPARVCHVQLGPMSELLSGDEAAESMMGWTLGERGGLLSLDLIHPDDRTNLVGCFVSALSTPTGTARARGRLQRGDGSWLWTEISMRNVPGASGGHLDVELVDISNEMAAQEQLRARERLLDRLTNALPIGVVLVDRDTTIQFTNDRVGPITGVGDASTLLAQFANVVDADRERLDEAIQDAVVDGKDCDLEVRLIPAAGQPERINRLTFRPLVDDREAVTGAAICVEDVTEQAIERAELATRATLDPLTRTLNREAILDRLRRLLAQPTATTVVFIDLDGFKRVNDTLGHIAGDRYLRIAVERMQSALRDHDLIGRIGGDEFIAVCPGLSRSDVAMAVAERMAAALDRAVPGAHDVHLRASIGVAIGALDEPVDAEELLGRADRAMYESKRAARGRPVLASHPAG
jgi:diguanylate cyclase (GGDEF)-like protein/PAS domain S-box-containing protein